VREIIEILCWYDWSSSTTDLLQNAQCWVVQHCNFRAE